MTVRKIIESKQISGVVTIAPDETVASAAKVLTRHKIGAVVVSRGGKGVDGILSERDIVKCLGAVGPAALDKRVSDIMTAAVIDCAPSDTAHSVMEKMTSGRFRHMPVMEDGRMIGLISIGDVVKARIDEIEHENSALTGMITSSW